MILRCCGNFYLSNGENYEKMSRYTTAEKNRIKPYSNGHKTKSEMIYVSVCENCDCYIVKVIRKFFDYHKIEKEEYRGQKGNEYFYSHLQKFIEKPLPYPFANIKQSKTIPFIYGRTIDGKHQVPRYINECGNAGDVIFTDIKSIK